ncbi:uncharacterized protein isoform X1 [Rhodnius prolixus]|uniref:uncharacterized protein isoform X1 n=2 Tax=Rhodnius prolixus TaxID=13249 RepID=UPI003D18D6B4
MVALGDIDKVAANIANGRISAVKALHVAIFDAVADARWHFFTYYSAGNYSWIFWSENYEEGFKKIENIKIQWNSDIFLAIPGIRMYKIHRILHSTAISLPIYASWNESSEFNFYQVNNIHNLKGLLVRAFITIKNWQNETNVSESKLLNRYVDDPSEILPKLSYTVHNLLAEIYNFSWNLSLSFNKLNSNYLNQNDAEGQFLALQSGLVDVGLNLNQLTSKINAVDVIPSICKFRQGFVFRHPIIFTEATDLLRPFSTKVWLCLTITIFLCAIGLRIIFLHRSNEEICESSLSISILDSVGVLCQQGISSPSMKTSARIAHVSLLLLGSWVFAFYNAAIVILLLSPYQRYINSVDLLMKKQFVLGAEDLPYNRYYLGMNYDTRAQMVYDLKLKGETPEKDKFYKLSDGISMLENGRFAFFSHITNVYSKVGHFKTADFCSLTEIKVYEPFQVSGFVRKSLPYKELFIQGLILLKETGIITRENNYWLNNKPFCTGAVKSIAFNMHSLFLAYAVYAFGFLISLLILLLELLCNSNAKHKCWRSFCLECSTTILFCGTDGRREFDCFKVSDAPGRQ